MGAYSLNDNGSVDEYQHYQNVKELNYEVLLGLSAPNLDGEIQNTLSGRVFSRLPDEIEEMSADAEKNRALFMKIRPEFINSGLHMTNMCHIAASALSVSIEERFKLMLSKSDNSTDLLLQYSEFCQTKK